MMKKLLAVLLAAVMLMGILAGCGEKDEKKILGSWTTTVDMTDDILEEMGDDAEGMNYTGKMNMIVTMTFNEDGKCSFNLLAEDRNEVANLLKEVFTASFGEMSDLFDDMTIDEILEYAEIDMDELVDEVLMNLEEEQIDTYVLEDGIVKFGDGSSDPYRFEGSTLILGDYTLTKVK